MRSKNALPQVSATSQAVLEVVAGIHEGVSIPLDRSVYSIGSQPSNDIMLADNGIAPEHGVIRLDRSAIIIEAAGGDIHLGRRHQIPRGHGCRTILPVELGVGSAVLRIARPRSSSRPWISGRVAPYLAALGGLGCIVLAVNTNFDTNAVSTSMAGLLDANAFRTATSIALARSTPPADRMPTEAASHGATPPTSLRVVPDTVADALNAKLREKGLLDIVTQAAGVRVVASGAISDEQRGAWSDIQRWFDRTYGDHFILASTVETRSPTPNPKFDLQAVSFGENPYVITADGQRRYPGAVLDKGWVIKEIQSRRLTLTKDGKDLALSF